MTKSPQNIKLEQAVLFLHIPKTAGSTMNTIIERQYPTKTIWSLDGIHPAKDINDFKNFTEAKKREIKVIKGHMGFGLHEYLPQPSTYFTLLRDPIERVISSYYYILNLPTHRLHQTMKSQQISLQKFVVEGLDANLDNRQTRFLAGVKGEPEMTTPNGKSSYEMLERAKKNLDEHFSVVGTVEEFDKTLLLLQKTFGWKNIFYNINNKNKKRPLKEKISQETLSIIREFNELDLELYAYAQESLHKLAVDRGRSFEQELQEFKMTNLSTYGKVSAVSASTISKIRKKIFALTN